jgi:hypothetical protein
MCKISSIPINLHLNNCGKDRSSVFVYLNCPKHLSQSCNDFSATGALSLICFKLKEHNLIFKLALHISYAYVINFYANLNVKNLLELLIFFRYIYKYDICYSFCNWLPATFLCLSRIWSLITICHVLIMSNDLR